MRNREQRRADARKKPTASKSVDKKKKMLRIVILAIVAVMVLGIILLPFFTSS